MKCELRKNKEVFVCLCCVAASLGFGLFEFSVVVIYSRAMPLCLTLKRVKLN